MLKVVSVLHTWGKIYSSNPSNLTFVLLPKAFLVQEGLQYSVISQVKGIYLFQVSNDLDDEAQI